MINNTDIASKVWYILVNKYESTDPSKISIVRTKYENYHMTEGQSVIMYITIMKEFKNPLKRMGKIIPDSTYAATLLRNIPESWHPIAQTIWMITHNLDEIEECFDVHESNLNALEISIQAGTAFAVQTCAICPSQPRILSWNQHAPRPDYNHCIHGPPRPRNNLIHCNNCGRAGHPASWCYAQGGGLVGQTPWMQNHGAYNNALQSPMYKPMPTVT